MNHGHSKDAQAFYLDQLCTIALCGMLGGIAVMMWQQDLLKNILKAQFHLPVLSSGVALIGLVVIRAVVLWRTVEQTAPDTHRHHDHDHEHHDHQHEHDHQHPGHEQEHGHDHDHCHDHEHEHEPACCHGHVTNNAETGHDHSHGWSPWRYAVLLLPIALYFLDLTPRGLSEDHLQRKLQNEVLENAGFLTTDALGGAAGSVGLFASSANDGAWLALASLLAGQEQADRPIPLDFHTLRQAAFVPQLRQQLEGKTGKLLGQYLRGQNDYTCRLVRISMRCCITDAQPLNVMIVSREKLSDLQHVKPMDWVEIEGQIQFRNQRNRNELLPVLQIKGRDNIKPTEEPKDPFL